MVEAMDLHIGRLMAYLQSIGEYENTIFIFTSDNGAEGSNVVRQDGNSVLSRWFENVGYNTEYESLGEPNSWNSIGASNATIAASPLYYYKFHASEGGLRVPLVMAGPGISRSDELTDEFVFVTDLMPTILSLVGIESHRGNWQNKEVEPIIGKDFSAFLAGNDEAVHDDSSPIGYELGGNSALFKGDYKVVINRAGQNESDWHLFNIKADLGETTDLAQQMPALLEEMVADYEVYVQTNNVLPMSERAGGILGGARR